MASSDISGKVKPIKPAFPMIYAYTTPEVPKHDGWIKIGYTEQDVHTRIKQQVQTADIEYSLEWIGNAVFDDASGDTFRDTQFHTYLRKLDYKNRPNTEWFCVSGNESHCRFNEFRSNRGILSTPSANEYSLRDEQKGAVEKAFNYAKLHESGEFLWNAKPRFGKTLSAYDLCKRLDANTVLIVTNRPAIANSWYDDYVKFLGAESKYHFVSSTKSLEGRPCVKSREEYLTHISHHRDEGKRCIEFVSLQDLKGSVAFGGAFDKLKHIADMTWDILIIDEAHEGVDTYKSDVAFDQINRKFTLHLSGTPFKALANEKFPSEAIYNWTYADEQCAKQKWDNIEESNPYADLPQLNMFTYKMSDIVANELADGIEIDGETVEYAFDLNEFFATNGSGKFLHSDAVDMFLDALVTQKKFPFSTPELRNELKHTFWMLNRVDSAKALASKLNKHELFKEYDIVLAAGDGRLEEDDAIQSAFEKVTNAIKKHDKTITLSVGQLSTGVTIPEWTAVLMLSNMKSPSLYMQSAFRAQNPCLFRDGGKFYRKENAYVFDFDPARTLTIFEEFANDLHAETASGKGDLDTRKQNVRELLNFFPVIGEDENGEMIELDAEKVLSIPRKIHSQEVVKRGFMCNYLFQNIGSVFSAPSSVVDILKKFEPVKEKKKELGINSGAAEELCLNDEGDVDLPDALVVGQSKELFGDKVYGEIQEELDEVIAQISVSTSEASAEDKQIDKLADMFATTVARPLIDAVAEHDSDLGAAQSKKVQRRVELDVSQAFKKKAGNYKIERNLNERDRERELEHAVGDEEIALINEVFDEQGAQIFESFVNDLHESKQEVIETAGQTIVREVETGKKEKKKNEIEGGIRDHLRGFSRTIPSFLMAYGDEETTLENFDTVIPDDVFLEVTSITADEFRFLRDGGEWLNPESGEMEYFKGNLFDSVVFDDSVYEFVRLRGELADYFDESQKDDIFDYVPPQKTNQIFTPKRVVKQMIDLFEQENPGCFDDPSHTFADLYMKSGLYITEIVKRLYNSPAMVTFFPDESERLKHIFENQVFGIAPTEIIYKIATNFILGYNSEIAAGCDTNFVVVDSAALAKEGKLAEFVETTFGAKL